LVCVAVAGTARAAPASGGRHLPYFSLMNERVGVKKLPIELRLSFGWFPGGKRAASRPPKRGPVWFGEVERPKTTIMAAGNGQWVCETEESNDEELGGGGGCTTLAATRELFNLDVSSCGKGPPRQFRIAGLVPNGVTGIEVERSDRTIGRTVPVIENTVAFTVGREDIVLRGVGDSGAEKLERKLPLAHLAKFDDDGSGACASYTIFEATGGG
jgi:hypothetical protein